MNTAQVVETSVTVLVNNNNPIQDYVHPDDQIQPTKLYAFVIKLLFCLQRTEHYLPK